MRTKQGSTLQSLRAAQTFLDTHAERLGGIVRTGARKDLDDAIIELTSHASAQTGSFLQSKGSTQQAIALRKALLRDHMAPIARIAAANLPSTPAVKPLRMPRGRPTAEQLAAAAEGMGDAAAPFAATFTRAGLPEDFVARLKAAAAAMLDALGDRTQSRGQIKGATTGLKGKLSDGRKIVRVLDSFVQIALQDDPALLAEWNVVKRVRLTPVRPVSAPSNPAQPATGGVA